jgi:hypothetical protein
MNADNENLRAIEGMARIPGLGIDLVFQPPDPETIINSSHFVVTYSFQPVATRNPHYRGIRELKSPLSDY